jgi:hypothetical protein
MPQSEYDEYNEIVRQFRAIIRRNQFYIEKRKKGADRRVAFFSWILGDRRIAERRQQHCLG